MTEKKSPNPFIEMAKQAKKLGNPKNSWGKENKAPKPNTKGFGGPSVIRRSGRGG